MTRGSDEDTPDGGASTRNATLRDRIVRLEVEVRSQGSDLREQRRATEKLEARLWVLVTGAAGLGSAAGATAGAWFTGG